MMTPIQQRLRDAERADRRSHNAEARFFTDGWRACCVCGFVGEWRHTAVSAKADAINHNEAQHD